MLHQRRLHLERPDPVGRRDDHVVGAAHEPEIAVLVGDRPVAAVVPVATKRAAGGLRVTPVFAEQPHRALRRDPHRHVALLARIQHLAVVVDHAHVEAWRRLAHRTRPHRQAAVVGDQIDRLGLPEAVVDRQTRRLPPDLDHLRVERLTRRHAMAQARPVVAGQVLEHQRAEHRRRRAERRDPMVAQQPQQQVEVGLATQVPQEVGRPQRPLAEQLAPGGLGPAEVRQGPVQVGRLEVLPEAGGDLVADAKRRLRVQHHLGGHRPRGEVDQQRVVGAGRLDVRRPLARLLQPAGPRGPAGRDLLARPRVAHPEPLQRLQAQRLGGHVDLAGVLRIGDRRGGAGPLQPVGDVARGQQGGARHGEGAQLDAAEHHVVPVGDARQHDEDAVALADAAGGQEVGRPVGGRGQVGEAVAARVAAVRSHRQQRQLAGLPGRPAVDHVTGVVVDLGHLQPERRPRRRVVGHVGRQVAHERTPLPGQPLPAATRSSCGASPAVQRDPGRISPVVGTWNRSLVMTS